MVTALLVAICGGAGALARFSVDALVQSRLGGAFLLGLLVGAGARHGTMLLAGTAALGSYTTFSTWMLETHRPAQDGEAGLAWANVAVSLAAGLAAVALGRAAGGLL
jgi:CrcB protein